MKNVESDIKNILNIIMYTRALTNNNIRVCFTEEHFQEQFKLTNL